MNIYVNGVLTPPADAGSLDGVTAALQPTAGKDGQVVTFNEANDELTLAPASGGFPNPMTAEGDVIIGGAAGAPTKLAVGTAGYFLRVAAGRPAWREFSAVGLIGVRPAAAAVREGMIYWATDGAAGLQASQCWHKGGSTYAWETVPYGVTATGIALVQAVTASAALGVLPLPPFVIPLTGYATTTGVLTAVALVTFNPTLYAITGKTAALTLETTGSVSVGGLTGTVTLQNLTDATTDATISIVSTSTVTQTASVALPASTKVYELRIALTGIGYVVAGAILRINWS